MIDRDSAPPQEVNVADLAMMLRRMIWMARKETGDTSMKVLASNAEQLLAKYQLHGNPLREDDISADSAAQADVRAATVGGVDVSGLADCFDHNELRGRSPIREFTSAERRIIAIAIRALSDAKQP